MTKPRKKGAIKGPEPTYNWGALLREYLELKRVEPSLTLKVWVTRKDMPYTWTSRQFALLSRQVAGETLAMLAPRAAERLGDFLDAQPEFALKAATAILDRAGHSPQAVTLTVNQQTNVQFAIPPLFSADYVQRVNKLIRPVVIDAP